MTKNGNGEGSIYQRGDGKWCAAVSLPDGKRKVVYGRTRREAGEQRTNLLKSVQDGQPVPTGRQTIGQFLTRWLEDVAKPSVKVTTYQGYRVVVEKRLIPAIGKVPLGKLTPQAVQAYLNGRTAAGANPRTVALDRAVLRRALGQAVKWQMIASNPAQLVDPPRQRRYQSQVWTPDETRRFLTTVRDDRFEGVFVIAAYLGLRQGEIRALQWHDIDVERGTLRVNGSMPTAGPAIIAEPKTDRSRRALPLPAGVVEALHRQRVRQLEARLQAGELWQESNLVFTGLLGGPVDRMALHHRFKVNITRAGVRDVRFHDLRHLCASLLLTEGVPARVVSDVLGHSSIKTTMDIYAHVMPHLLADAAAKMDAVMSARTG